MHIRSARGFGPGQTSIYSQMCIFKIGCTNHGKAKAVVIATLRTDVGALFCKLANGTCLQDDPEQLRSALLALQLKPRQESVWSAKMCHVWSVRLAPFCGLVCRKLKGHSPTVWVPLGENPRSSGLPMLIRGMSESSWSRLRLALTRLWGLVNAPRESLTVSQDEGLPCADPGKRPLVQMSIMRPKQSQR